ncbi:MAG: HU family DNA-binding protein [Oscillospiraceae bacterium]
MNKQELITSVASKSGLSKKDAEGAVVAFVDAIETALKAGEKVQLVGFGSFEVRERAARTGRNPQTGAEMNIADAKVPTFKAGQAFKNLVNNK